MRLAALVATVLAFAAGSAVACPMHTAGHEQTVAQSNAPKKPPQSQASAGGQS
jgi:hypothetical protein